jgi:hypothetical protein
MFIIFDTSICMVFDTSMCITIMYYIRLLLIIRFLLNNTYKDDSDMLISMKYHHKIRDTNMLAMDSKSVISRLVIHGKFSILFMLLFIFIKPVSSEVLISGVYPNAIGTESGGEAIELFNPTNRSINLSGWRIATERSENDVIFGDSDIIHNSSYFIVADEGWSTYKDDSNWPDADLEDTITLYDYDSGIALYNSNGSIVSAIGWGDKNSIDPEKYETVPVDQIQEGEMILRKYGGEYYNTGNNSHDFYIGTPLWKFLTYVINDTNTQNDSNGNSGEEDPDEEILDDGNLSDPNIGEEDLGDENNSDEFTDGINLSIQVNNSVLFIESISMEDDIEGSGFDIFPYPGINRSVEISVVLGDFNGPDDIKEAYVTDQSGEQIALSLATVLNITHAVYSSHILVEYSMAPGEYSLIVHANDTQTSVLKEINYSILGVSAVRADTEGLAISIEPGKETVIRGDLNISTQNSITIKNIGNIDSDIGLGATDFILESNRIARSKISYTFMDDDFNSSLSGRFQEDLINTGLRLSPDESRELSLKIDAQYGIMAGNYSGQIFIYSG